MGLSYFFGERLLTTMGDLVLGVLVLIGILILRLKVADRSVLSVLFFSAEWCSVVLVLHLTLRG